MKRKEYEKPTAEVVELKQQQQLLAGSTPNSASIDDYEDGVFDWGSGAPMLDIEKGEFTW